MLATEEVITAILKVISATTKDIYLPVLLSEANSICIELNYHWDWLRLDLHGNLFYVYFLSIYNNTRIV